MTVVMVVMVVVVAVMMVSFHNHWLEYKASLVIDS